MNLDIHSAVVMAIILLILGALLGIWTGLDRIRKSRKVAYFRLRRKQMTAGWRTIFFGLVMVGLAFLVGIFSEPITYRFFPPSPSPSLTPTISLTPSLSLSPTITLTPSITLTPVNSYTPTVTVTPFLPISVETHFTSLVTPNPDAVFSQLVFSLVVHNHQAIKPQIVFQNPLSRVYVTYSYDGMTDGVQWTAIWYLAGELLKYETGAWEGGTGGYGLYQLDLPTEQWRPGTYQLVFFVGTTWKVIGEFRVIGEPPTATLLPTASFTATATQTSSRTRTPVPSRTTRPTNTRWPSLTRTPTK